ncbi:hypothetical protein C491_11970 [Natronococcus amylolyticus DSM 10524]|uniref:Uncharacterized protein n=1 Tax=Natronococcus amylolyticus DSM 10524 TaxID=1227497 RepID=L9X4K0_9EURY|nr:hypothetical protein [Natronococcus amylolyticus]ELY56719.1 hypothetical protein C491_11970 [Natronococcus amylolyticus DSM 10524]
MCDTFTDDDIGARVETAGGETVGVVAAVDGAVVRVCPPPATDGPESAAPAMATGPDETRPLEPAAVAERKGDRLVLEPGRSLEFDVEDQDRMSAEDEAAALEATEPTDRGAEAGPDALTDREPEAELDPSDPGRSPEVEMSIDEDPDRTNGTNGSNDDRRDEGDSEDR